VRLSKKVSVCALYLGSKKASGGFAVAVIKSTITGAMAVWLVIRKTLADLPYALAATQMHQCRRNALPEYVHHAVAHQTLHDGISVGVSRRGGIRTNSWLVLDL